MGGASDREREATTNAERGGGRGSRGIWVTKRNYTLCSEGGEREESGNGKNEKGLKICLHI